MNPVVLRSFQKLDYKHSLPTIGEVVTLRVMNNFKRKWERTTWGLFYPCLSSLCSSWTLNSAKRTLFPDVIILMHPLRNTYLVVKTQGDRDFQVPAWNGRAQLFSACKKAWGLAKGMWHYAGGAPTLFLPRKVVRVGGGRIAAPGSQKKFLQSSYMPAAPAQQGLSELSFGHTLRSTECLMHLSHCSHVPQEPF